MANVELKDHFLVLQTSEIPVNGDLSNVMVQLYHQYSIVDIETGLVLGKSPGEGIINVGTPAELDVKYPGFSDWMENIKIVLVTETMQIINNKKTSGLAVTEVSNNPNLMP